MTIMNILLVLAHPEPKSFNAALHDAALSHFNFLGHSVETSNLYQLDFNPVSDYTNFINPLDSNFLQIQREERFASSNNGFNLHIKREMLKVEACDLMIWQFPLWWFSVPAILKGWVDKVFACGFAYGGGSKYETGVFAGKQAMLSITTGAAKDAYEEGGFQGEIENILWPIHRGIFEFTGFEVLEPHIIYDPAKLTKAQRKQEIIEYQNRLSHSVINKVI